MRLAPGIVVPDVTAVEMTATPTVWMPREIVHSSRQGQTDDPVVVDIGQGRYVVVWTDRDSSPGFNLVGQIFDARGNRVGGEFVVNSAFVADNEQHAALDTRPAGGFIMAYEDVDAAGTSIRVETRDVNGVRVDGLPTTIESDTGADVMSHPSVAVRADGGYLVTYNRTADADGFTNVVGHIVSSVGTLGPEFVIQDSSDAARNPDADVLANGNYVVVFEDADDASLADFDPQFRILNPAGGIVTGAAIDQSANPQDDVHVAALAGGGFVAVWTERSIDAAGDDVRARIYDGAGAPQGAAFTVNSFAENNQNSPDAVALDDGGFVVVWTNDILGVVRGQRFDAVGAPMGVEFTAGTVGNISDPAAPDIARLSDGRVVVAYEHVASVRSAGQEVVTMILDPRTTPYSGTSHNDVITARIEGAQISGLGGNDTLWGMGGNDVLVGGPGNDTLDGGGGSDTAVFSGTRANYLLTRLANGGVRVVDLRGGSPDGTDTLQNIENFAVAEGTFPLSALLNDAPVITSNGGGSNAIIEVVENASAVTTVRATDADGGGTLTFAIAGGADAARFRIDGASGVLSFVAAPDFEAPADADRNNSYLVRVRASDGSQFDEQSLTVNVIDENETAGHLAALGDVLWRHDDGTVATADHDLGAVPLNWRIATTGDFDGDGDTDILWRHRDGMVVTWEMENGQYVTNHNIAFASVGWEIVDAGDFDADGDDDVLWRHRDGAVVTWEMEDGQYVVNRNIAFASTGWEIDGLGDFDADGDADVIWRHRDGAVVTWEMEDGNYVQNHNIAFGSTSWQIQETGDFDGDGDADILWRHREGAVVSWEMQHGNYVTNRNLRSEETAWQIAGTGDFDADRSDDILWRHSDGTVVTWDMEGGQLAQVHNFGAVSNAWHIVRTGEFDLA